MDMVYRIKNGTPTRLSKYRLSDNYLRFYLKCIAPHAENIKKDLYEATPLEEIIAWESVVGLQFENCVLKNLSILLPLINIQSSVVKTASPYFQRTTNRQKTCQIDLLIQTKHSIYICEIKTGNHINSKCIGEVKEKVLRLAIPSGLSVRTVLIYDGNIEPEIARQGYFDYLIPFGNLLN